MILIKEYQSLTIEEVSNYFHSLSDYYLKHPSDGLAKHIGEVLDHYEQRIIDWHNEVTEKLGESLTDDHYD